MGRQRGRRLGTEAPSHKTRTNPSAQQILAWNMLTLLLLAATEEHVRNVVQSRNDESRWQFHNSFLQERPPPPAGSSWGPCNLGVELVTLSADDAKRIRKGKPDMKSQVVRNQGVT